MAYSTTIPILSGLAILATVTGVSLGHSAIAEINPAHFREPSSHFYGDLVPYRASGNVDASQSVDDYFQPEPAYSVSPSCRGCTDYPVAFMPKPEKPADGDDGWSDSAASEAVLAGAEKAAPEPPPANRQWIERYTTYTVVTETVEPTPIATVEAEPAEQES